jgi:uncharacterized protein (TIGR01777 family)
LVRDKPNPERQEVYWQPSCGQIDHTGLEGTDAVVHLAGENIFGLWTKTKKEQILQSRRQGTELLSVALGKLHRIPRVLISVSAVGYYGNTGDRVVNENNESGGGFLAGVCRLWEEATRPAEDVGIRTVHLRLGVVLSAKGGALALMRVPFGLALGGCVGSGDQYMSWIHIEDLVRLTESVLLDENFEGPVNAVAPSPVTNRTFAKTLGKVLNRPTVFWVPGPLLRLALGQMAEEVLLWGQRVDPERLRNRQFHFYFPELELALARELG